MSAIEQVRKLHGISAGAFGGLIGVYWSGSSIGYENAVVYGSVAAGIVLVVLTLANALIDVYFATEQSPQ